MRDASVGFQCPECVASGNASVRQPRTAAGGAISTNVGAVTTVIIAINTIVLAVEQFGGRLGDRVYQWGALQGYAVADQHEYWRLLTGAFLHLGVMHLLFNMYALFLFGPFMEHVLGRWRFIASYLTLSVASGVFVYVLSDPGVATVGASGAVFGLFGLALIFLIRAKQNITGMLVMLAINAVISASPHISWQGHLGGFIVGAALGVVFAYGPRHPAVHTAAFAFVWLLIVAFTILRTINLTA